MSGRGRRYRICVLLLALLLALPDEALPANLEAKPSSVQFLPLDDDIADEIKVIDKLIDRKEWRKAIEKCQKLIAKPHKAMIEIRPGVYGSPRGLCELKLRGMPAAGKLLYQTLYDPEAERLFQRALKGRNVGEARKLVGEFAYTSVGPSGIALLADLLFEKGDVRGALDQWTRWMAMSDLEATKEPVRRRMAVKLAVAAAKLGDKAALDRAIKLFGEKGMLVELGSARIARAAELKKFVAPMWPKSGGGRSAAPALLDFKRWSVVGSDRYAKQAGRYSGSGSKTSFSCHGKLLGGIFYINNPEGVRAVDAVTGRIVWQRSGRNYGGQYYHALRSLNFYCTVPPAAEQDGTDLLFVSGGSRLAAHDRVTGRALWTKMRGSFAAVEEIGNDPNMRVAFSSPVLYRRGAAHVVLETSQGQVYLMAFGAKDGRLLWSTNVGGSAQQPGYKSSFPASLTMSGGDIVFCNGRGIIGKCDAATGEIRWLVPYRRREQFVKGHRSYQIGRLRQNPLVTLGDSVFCMPSDGQELFSMRVSDGRVNWAKEISLDRALVGGAPSPKGGGAGRLFLVGNRTECLSAASGSVAWDWPVPEADPIGHGRLTARHLTIATRRGVYVLSRKTGELDRFRPLALPGWRDVLVASDKDSMVLSSNNSVVSVGLKGRTEELVRGAPAKKAGHWAIAIRARLRQDDGRTEDALRLYAEAIKAAKQSSRTTKFVAELQAEALDVLHARQQAEWKAGRHVEAFLWMSRALRFSPGLPYSATLAYGTPADTSAAPHTVVMTSGDRISGTLSGISNGTVKLAVRGEAWRIAAGGVDVIIIGPSAQSAHTAAPGRQYVLLVNGDRISGAVEAACKDALALRTSFGSIDLKLGAIAQIVLRGHAIEALGDNVVYVTLRNGDRLSGVVRAFDGARLLLHTPFCGTRSIELGAIRAISNRRAMPPRKAGRRRSSAGMTRPLRPFPAAIRIERNVEF